MVLALLLLFARAVAIPMPMAGPADPVALAALHTICHVPDGSPAPEPGHHPAHDGCLLCPACHLAAAALLPAAPAFAWQLAIRAAAHPGTLPQATGPPHAIRLAARPTGPPIAFL